MLNLSNLPKSHAELGVATVDRVANYLIKCSPKQADALISISDEDWTMHLELQHSTGLSHFAMFTDEELTVVEVLVRGKKYGRLVNGCYALRSFASRNLEGISHEV